MKTFKLDAEIGRKTEDVHFLGFHFKTIGPDSLEAFLKDCAVGEKVKIEINSPGGSVIAGLAMANMIKNSKAHVIGHVVGVAASMASVVACACDEVKMEEAAFLMIHNPWSEAEGDAEELKHAADVLERMEVAMRAFYRGKFPNMADAELDQLMADETWMTGADCVARGMVCELVPSDVRAAACVTRRHFKHIPEAAAKFLEIHEAKEAPAESAPEQTAFGRAPLAVPFAAKALDLAANAAASDGASIPEERGAARLRPRQVRLKLFLSFVVETVGVNEYRVCASFPASVGSQLTFTTSTPDVRVGSVRGAIASPSAIMDEGKSEMRFLGLGRGGERTEITWQRLLSSSSSERTVCQVEGAEVNAVLSAVDVKYDATVPTRVYGGESDVFYIRLPEGAEYAVNSLRAVNSSGASFALAAEPEVKTEREICDEETLAAGAESNPAASEQNARSERRYLRITLEQPTSFVAFSLQASVASNRDADSRTESKRMTCKIDGFSVCEYRRSESGGALVDAQKQTGKIVVSTPGDSEDLRFDVTPGFGASVGSDGVSSEQGDVFSFFAQPFTLTAQEYKRQEITNVKPEYRLTVENNETKLRARFKFSVYGKKATEFYVRLYDWKFTEQHGELLDLGRIDSDPETGVTVLPLKAPADGEVLIDLELVNDAELGAEKELRLFTLPTPEADRIEAAALVVVPSSNVEVDPDEANCAELSASSPRNLSIEMPAASTAQPALYFRTNQATKTPDKEIAPAVFAARVKKRDRELSATTELHAELSEKGEIRVTQKFNFNVKYEDLAGITLVVPPALASANGSKSATNFKYTANGDAVPLYAVRDELDDLTGETLRRIPRSVRRSEGRF